MVLNFPFLAAGFAVKLAYFSRKGFGREYAAGLWKGIVSGRKIEGAQKRGVVTDLKIQFQLYYGILVLLSGLVKDRDQG